MKSSRFLSALALALVSLSTLISNPAHAQTASKGPTLGVGVDVIPATNGDSALGTASNLWFLIKPGESGSRKVIVRSTANISGVVTPSMVFGMYVNGSATWDEARVSPLAKWTTFSDNAISLRPGEEKEITMTISIPKGAAIGTNIAFLFLAMNPEGVVKKSGRFSIGGAARVGVPIFLGIGTIDQIAIDFQIIRTSTSHNGKTRYINVTIKNIGKTPIAPVGYLTIKNVTGDIQINQKFPLYSKTLPPDAEGTVSIRVPDSIPNGAWVVDEFLQQGAQQKTNEATITLTTSNFWSRTNVMTILFIALFALMLIWGLILRRRKTKDHGEPNAPTDAMSDEVQKWIAELEKSLATPKAKKKKAPAKKAAKKSPAKKIAKKVAKKAPVKKAVKKAPVKKTAKKAVKKSPPKRR